ncbi:hypothetical protein GDO78_022433 [Eleutherodactylus coqui]|uniref:Uncharacterized protein n=1 Tax=Eleutherodactylus coqui TaxID=57060 RepID=A0A8J6BCE3_ELECQ|nr:hypothetical protein GDO78_022433 [Eleutherodactylus coqui]
MSCFIRTKSSPIFVFPRSFSPACIMSITLQGVHLSICITSFKSLGHKSPLIPCQCTFSPCNPRFFPIGRIIALLSAQCT